MLKIKIILGSTREGRFGDKAAQWIFDQAKQREGVEVELLDLKDYPMPFFDQPKTPSSITEPYPNPVVQKWTAKIGEADAYIIATAEYNHGIPAVLKNALDWVYKDWNRKAVGFVGWGTVGGARSVEQLRLAAAEVHMVSVRAAVHIITPWLLLDDTGALKPGALDPYTRSAKDMLDQLIWWGNAAKAARALPQ